MFKKIHSKKGFTLAELLIVVAIIAVLTAIAIPVFSSQLEKAKIATDEANCRSAYGEAMATYLAEQGSATAPSSGTISLGGATYSWSFATDTMTVSTTSGTSNKYTSGISYNGTAFTAGTSTGG